MADGDLDLDAMLDSALDEEFDAPTTAPDAGAGSDGELDLDAMLDEALDGEAAAAPEQKQSAVASEKTPGAARQVLVAFGLCCDVDCVRTSFRSREVGCLGVL